MSIVINGGWLGIEAERSAQPEAFMKGVLVEYCDVARQVERDLERNADHFGDTRRPFTWDLERSLHAEGKLPDVQIPHKKQDTGNCVAASLAVAGMKRHVIELALGREEEKFREWYIPWIYAVSRNQVGGGIVGDGSLGVWGAEAVSRYGVLFSDDEGVPPYAGYSDRWGHRSNVRNPEYQKFFEVAHNHKVLIARLQTVEEIEASLQSGRMVTIASSRGFNMTPRIMDGYHVFVPAREPWYHQMSFTDVLYEPFQAFYRQNQWGPNAHGRPLNGETPGGAWNLLSDVREELRNKQCEVYAYFDFTGDESGVDWGIF